VHSGIYSELVAHYGLDADSLAKTIERRVKGL
jgi:hypothetical protein